MVLSEEFKRLISEISDPKFLEQEIISMNQTLKSEYCTNSLRLELTEKITFIKEKLSELQ